jgi:hypothetical protein
LNCRRREEAFIEGTVPADGSKLVVAEC